MSTEIFKTPMEVAVYQLHNFSISFFSSLVGGDVVSVKLDNSASGASVVAIDNKIEQAMDLVKNHLMYAVREEVEILKEQIRELAEKNNQLERENSLLKNLASPEQMESFRERVPSDSDALVPLRPDNQYQQQAQQYQQQAQIGLHNPDQSCHISAGSAV
ncbi:TSC22 domain family protein 3 isoform X2 [Oncorhynchus tshawytscha]|uniref:TSC22 domain family protein 3 isoform X2 n=1 Tax=Oncorhynchus tshawytscha TaxID=74940 RepID=UPI000D09F3B7|nr:TSC22 domain family protein 3 isoform X2 [Oncorhynchus tshawytscha]